MDVVDNVRLETVSMQAATPEPMRPEYHEITPPGRVSLRGLLIGFIGRMISARRLNPMRAGRLLNMPAAQVPLLTNGETPYSVEKVMALVVRLGYDVHIAIEPTPAGRAGQIWLDLPPED